MNTYFKNKKRGKEKEPTIVCIGGGTGLFSLLSGLKSEVPDASSLKAIVTTLDNGGSSGALMTQYGVLPPGDIRNCIVALSNQTQIFNELFQYRFDKRINNHTLGNLFLTALNDITGSFEEAVKVTSQILQIKGEVIPVSLDSNTLIAKLDNGEELVGETLIDTTKDKKISSIYLKDKQTPANKRAIETIKQADIIVFGPGDLYTSILPNVLFPQIKEAIAANKKAKKVLITPIMSKPGETDDFFVADFKEELEKYLESPITDLIVNTSIPTVDSLQGYYREKKYPILLNKEKLSNVRVLKGNLIDNTTLARHSPEKLAKAVMKLTKKK